MLKKTPVLPQETGFKGAKTYKNGQNKKLIKRARINHKNTV